MKKLGKVAVGGTFDELHRGHKTLIDSAFEIGEKVVIGLSSDDFVAKMGKPHVTASYAERHADLEAYLKKNGWSKRGEIVPLNDSYGLTLSGKDLDGLIVSKETAAMADQINLLRKKAGLPLLKIFAVAMVPAENSVPISTTRIRRGEIDRNGHVLKATAK